MGAMRKTTKKAPAPGQPCATCGRIVPGRRPRVDPNWDGAALKANRRFQGISQVALGEKLGVSAKTVIAWEQGRPPLPKVQRRLERIVKAKLTRGRGK